MSCNDDEGTRFLELVRMAAGDRHQLVGALARRADAGDFAGVAFCVKKAISKQAGLPLTTRMSLLRAFGAAFSGNSVGHLGNDIVLGALLEDEPQMRVAAFDCLEHWLDDDDDGRWLDLLRRVREREREPFLMERLDVLIEGADICEESCPACGNDQDIQRYPDGSFSSWVCGDCGKIWDEAGEIDDEEFEDEETGEDDRPPAWRHLLEERGSSSRARALLERRAVPEFLQRVLDVHPHLTLDLLETLDIGHLSVRANDLELVDLELGVPQVRVVLRGGCRGFSLEPTATPGHYLLFAYF